MKTDHAPLNAVAGTAPFALAPERSAVPSPGPVARPNDVPAAGSTTAIMRLMAEAEARDTFLVGRPLYTRYAPGLTSENGRAIARSGFWSGVGFVGASLAAAGMVLLSTGGANPAFVLGLVGGGSALAAFGWRTAWHVLDRVGRPAGGVAPDAAASVAAKPKVARGIAFGHPRTSLSAG